MYKTIHIYISNHLHIDECSIGTHNWLRTTQTCMNNHGSFTCEFSSGYELDVDGTTCNGMYKPLVLFW